MISSRIFLVFAAGFVTFALAVKAALFPAVSVEGMSEEDLDAPFLATPQNVVDEMLYLADPQPGEKLYDLGCGDGRIVVTAAEEFGIEGVGIDLDPLRVRQSRVNALDQRVAHLATFTQADLFEYDFSDASIVTLYLSPRLNAELAPKFMELKPGSRIISHYFNMPGYKPDKVVRVKSLDSDRYHAVYLWTVPLTPVTP